ncbi:MULTISPECIES: ROK family protein [unclassified Devosia]|uniref:ROK family protein n=1 Tax=unclassified Devosia TaxID=196773 RepID=UPI00086DA864|nr:MULTISPECIES: ROK family protein [unclassified Devosia]MBN9362782.1 ROK family protein [Devosia sp.]ODS88341.1 MAG: hypothetical protein ABS47_09425 [Devosia sp. SCN 66-27]OJX23958.1 MAG: hypothetical protein BGO83_03665 [Devosia sp. 66-14]
MSSADGGPPLAGDTAPLVAALDFGGTKLALGLVDRSGRVIDTTVAMRDGRSPEEVVTWTSAELKVMLDRHGLCMPVVAGLGATVPGYVDRQKRVLEFAPAHGWRDVRFAEMLEEALSLPSAIENDVNACALAERRFGCAASGEDMLWVTVSTGIGGALVLNGELFEGQGAAGEIGHVVVEEGGRVCGCGHRGCLEATAGGLALGRIAQDQGLEVSTAKEVFELAAAGNLEAAEIVSQATTAIARAIAFATNLLDVPLVVLGGAIGLVLDLDDVRARVTERILLPPERVPKVSRTALGQNAALLGAAVRFLENGGSGERSDLPR